MTIKDVHTATGKSLADVLHDFKIETISFVTSRLDLFEAEMRQKAENWKSALPKIVIGAALLFTAWLLVTGAIVAAVAMLLPNNPWAYAISFGAVGIFYAIIGAILAISGRNAFSREGLKPEKTVRVLLDDRVWIESQATRLRA
jgi:VIT1/CCC1 family predicted Fe2+/Mn2+ transporter